MTKIKNYLDAASAAYYAGKPFLSDEAFDKLAESAGYYEVGAKQHENVKKHYRRMYSLVKHYEDEGASPLPTYNKVTTPKLDGAAISLLYIEGVLVQALTRGDGVEGRDITDKMYSRKDLVPLIISYKDILQVTGEIVSPKEIENARNYAAGALNLKDLAEFNTRAVSFFAYSVYPYITELYSKDMDFLESNLGFNTILANDIHNIYPCDGLVFRIDNNQEFESLGYTANHPLGSYAKKTRQEAVETKIISVEWQVGRTGRVTPVAILEPVMVGDAVVSRATLNNPKFIDALGICIGDTVGVVRAGMIIPQILYKVDA